MVGVASQPISKKKDESQAQRQGWLYGLSTLAGHSFKLRQPLLVLGNQAARIRKDVTQKAKLNCKVEDLPETGDRPEAVPTNPYFIMALRKGLIISQLNIKRSHFCSNLSTNSMQV